MKYGIILSLCFLPLGIMFAIMKLSLLFSSSVSEVKYVKEDAKREHGPYLENPYGDVDEEDEKY